MSIKSVIVRELLTSTKSYKEIVSTVRAEVGPHVQTTPKCIAFYASKLRKLDRSCLNHRKSAKAESLADLLRKFRTDVDNAGYETDVEELTVEHEDEADENTA